MISHSVASAFRNRCDGRSKGAGKRKWTIGVLLLFYCVFWQRWNAKMLLQIEIPVASPHNVPRGGWEFADLGVRAQFWSQWQLEPPTLTLCTDPRIVPDVIPRGNCAGSWRPAYHAKSNRVVRCLYTHTHCSLHLKCSLPLSETLFLHSGFHVMK